MKRFFPAFSARALITTLAVTLSAVASAQPFKMTTPIAPGVAVPDKIESSLGTLNLNHGYPSADTVEKIYDNLDRSRALQAYLMAIPIVNQAVIVTCSGTNGNGSCARPTSSASTTE